ncbi:RNA 3'-terminal phosphate cyclase [Physcia stellaris]|nr:RNA 3'-terminal phosphate cyclase [Physcia stellaris]
MFSALSNVRQTLTQVLNFALVLSTAFMLWKGLSVATDSPSPIVVVLSGSMEPAFQRGDLLFLWNRSQNTQIGEVVVYNVKGKDIPIVHRVVRKYGGGSKPLKLLTKGDNNLADDTELYAKGQDYLNRSEDIIGSVVGYVPFVGYVTILLSEHPCLTSFALSQGTSFTPVRHRKEIDMMMRQEQASRESYDQNHDGSHQIMKGLAQ